MAGGDRRRRTRERLERFCRILGGLRAEAPLLTLEELIERTMTAFGYDLGLIAREGGAGRMANVRKLMRLARDYEANEGRDLGGFLALAAESTRRDEREGMAAVQAEGHDGVRVMTVHAAKGLEFDVVAVPDLGRNLNAGHSHGDITIGRPSDDGSRRFGMRLAFPARKTRGAVGAGRPQHRRERGRGRGGLPPRLRRRLAGPRPADPLGRLQALRPRGRRGAQAKRHPAAAAAPGPGRARLRGRGRARSSCRRRGRWSGGEPVPPTTRLEIRTSEPGEKRAAELVRSFPPPEEDGPFATIRERRRPLLAEGPAPVPMGHLSYSALALYEQCGYRFYVERVLGAREALASAPGEAAEEAPEIPTEMPEPGRRPRARARDRQRGPRRARMERPARLARGRRRAARAPAGPRGARRATPRRSPARGGWSAAGSARSCAPSSAARPRAEVPFVLGLGGTVVRGKIDLLVDGERDPHRRRLQDRRPRRPLAGRGAARYAAQRQVYASRSAARPARGRSTSSSRRPTSRRSSVFDADGLRAAREHLSELIGRMRGGEFEVTDAPYAALCFGCPAAARLCPRPAWKPPRTVTQDRRSSATRRWRARASASQTLGRPVEFAAVARLRGWPRAWTLGREQAASEKTFARADGSIPRFCLGLNLEPDPRARRRRTAS